MKFKAIEKICKEKKRVVIYEGGAQWLGDGCAAYILRGAPLMDKQNILTMFDVPESKWHDWWLTQAVLPDDINFQETDLGEQEISFYNLGISYGGKELRIFDTQKGIAAIDEKYLAPLRDNAPYLRFFQRTTKAGEMYFAVKEGLLLVAVILPCDIAYEHIGEEAERFAKQIKKAIHAKEEDDRKKENDHIQVQINEFLDQLMKGENDGEAAH